MRVFRGWRAPSCICCTEWSTENACISGLACSFMHLLHGLEHEKSVYFRVGVLLHAFAAWTEAGLHMYIEMCLLPWMRPYWTNNIMISKKIRKLLQKCNINSIRNECAKKRLESNKDFHTTFVAIPIYISTYIYVVLLYVVVKVGSFGWVF